MDSGVGIVRLWVLGSGSKGNALLVECDGQRALVDVGFPLRAMEARLRAVGVAPESVDAAVITHEHGDHICGAARSARRWGWALHATAGTIAVSHSLREVSATAFEAGATLELDTMRIQTTPTSHDARESVALVLTSRRTGARLGIAYDLGAVTLNVVRALRDVDTLVVETNHDAVMLRNGPYPRSVQNRIASRRGHLENRDGATLARECMHAGLRQLVLAHVSENCNTPAAAHAEVTRVMKRTRFRGRIDVAKQRTIMGPYDVGGGRTDGVQLELTL